MNPPSAVAAFVGGWDPTGLAGLAVDLKTAEALGVHGSAAITAVTAQRAGRVLRIEPTSDEIFDGQLASLAALEPSAIKLGMLGSAKHAERLATWLADRRGLVVCDPVLRTSGGDPLWGESSLAKMRALMSRVDLWTPNLDETERLCDLAPGSLAGDPFGIERAAERLLESGAAAVLIKGGHDRGSFAQDLYATRETRAWLSSERGRDARGTGCALAAAIAAAWTWGRGRVFDLLDAIVVAKAHVRHGLRSARAISEDGARALVHAPWPPAAEDLPWITATAAAGLLRPRSPPIERIGFYPIVDRAADVACLARAGVPTVQLRIKDLQDRALRDQLAAGVDAARDTGCQLFINDHLALALELGAFGVHLGQEDLAATDPSQLFALAGAGIRLGISTHTYAELARASAVRPSYIALGPIYPTTLKVMPYAPQGPARLAEWKRLGAAPVVAIGGITLSRVGELRGADGISVVADLRVGDLTSRATDFLAALAS